MARAVRICVVLAVLSSTYAEAAERVWRIGVLARVDDSGFRSVILPYLATRGFVEGRNLVVDVRIGTEAQMTELARTMVTTKPAKELGLAIPPSLLVGAGEVIE